MDGIPRESIVAGNRIQVNEYSEVLGLENVFAIGDISYMLSPSFPDGHPMVAQVAIQQARTLGKNILLQVKNGTDHVAAFRYKDKGSMAIIGKKDAVADIKRVFLNGRIGWLIWSMIHLLTLTGFKNKASVAFSWMVKYFTYDKANQLIIRKYSPGNNIKTST